MQIEKAKTLCEEIKQKFRSKYGITLLVAGSLKRNQTIVHDIDFVTESPIFNSDRKFIKFKYNNEYVNIWRSNHPKFTQMMLTLTKRDAIVLRKVASNRGFRLNNYGIYKDAKRLNINSKKELLKLLNVHHIK